MQSQYLYINSTAADQDQNRQRKGKKGVAMVAVGTIALVGAAAAFAFFGNNMPSAAHDIKFYGDDL